MITSCNHSENIICGSCLMKNHQEKQVVENLLRGELLKRSLPYLEASLLGRLYSEMRKVLMKIKYCTKHLNRNVRIWKHLSRK